MKKDQSVNTEQLLNKIQRDAYIYSNISVMVPEWNDEQLYSLYLFYGIIWWKDNAQVLYLSGWNDKNPFQSAQILFYMLT